MLRGNFRVSVLMRGRGGGAELVAMTTSNWLQAPPLSLSCGECAWKWKYFLFIMRKGMWNIPRCVQTWRGHAERRERYFITNPYPKVFFFSDVQCESLSKTQQNCFPLTDFSDTGNNLMGKAVPRRLLEFLIQVITSHLISFLKNKPKTTTIKQGLSNLDIMMCVFFSFTRCIFRYAQMNEPEWRKMHEICKHTVQDCAKVSGTCKINAVKMHSELTKHDKRKRLQCAGNSNKQKLHNCRCCLCFFFFLAVITGTVCTVL